MTTQSRPHKSQGMVKRKAKIIVTNIIVGAASQTDSVQTRRLITIPIRSRLRSMRRRMHAQRTSKRSSRRLRRHEPLSLPLPRRRINVQTGSDRDRVSTCQATVVGLEARKLTNQSIVRSWAMPIVKNDTANPIHHPLQAATIAAVAVDSSIAEVDDRHRRLPY